MSKFINAAHLTNEELKLIINENRQYGQWNSRTTRKQLIKTVRFIQKTLRKDYENNLKGGCMQHGSSCDCWDSEPFTICPNCKNLRGAYGYCDCDKVMDGAEDWKEIK